MRKTMRRAKRPQPRSRPRPKVKEWYAIGDKVEYQGEKYTIADNRGKGHNLWGGNTGTKKVLDVPGSKLKPYEPKKEIVCGRSGNFIGKFSGSNTWHRIQARSAEEAKAKMLKGTRYTYSEVSVKRHRGGSE